MSQPRNRSALASPISPAPAAKAVYHPLTLALITACLATGCITDSQLLARNSSTALQTAKQEAQSTLPCPQVAGSIQSQKIVQGAPLGYLWTDYAVDVRGCGRQAAYTVTCLDEELCSADPK